MNRVIRTLLPVVVLAAGFGIAVAFIKTAPSTPKAEAPQEITLVDVLVAEASEAQVDVAGQGTVVASQVVGLKPEVGGRIVWVSPNLVQGGLVQNNELLFKIDDRDYVLAVEQLTSNVQRTRFELAQEKGRGRVAEREWRLLGEESPTTAAGKALALRQPQLKSAQSALAAAQSGLAKAKLDVKRTKVRAPFNAFVKNEEIEVGQVVDRQNNLGTLVGTDAFWVQVSLPVGDLRWIMLPDARGQGGSMATVVQSLSDGETIERPARVLRLAGDLDPKGRMARLIVAVKNPMNRKDGQLPLLLGAYVKVKIHGKKLDDVVIVPRRAMRSEDQIWVMNDKDELEVRSVQVAYRGQDELYLTSGIAPNERIVISRLAAAVQGMPLRTLAKDKAQVNP